MKKYTYLIRQVEAWASPDGWDYNNVFVIGQMITGAQNTRRALTSYLRRRCGITFQKNRTRIEFDGDNYTIVDRKTGEPLVDAVFQEVA